MMTKELSLEIKPQTLKTLSDSKLIERTEDLFQRERNLSECIMSHLQEIQDRELFITMGYESMYQCLIKHFKCSETIAYSRLAVLKVIKEIPDVMESLNSGELNLTHVSMAQTYFRIQAKKNPKEKISLEDKGKLLSALKNTSTKVAKQIIAEKDPVMILPPDHIRYLDQEYVQVQITAKKEILEKIERIKMLISHQEVNPSLESVFDLALTLAIESLEKKKGIYINPKNSPKKRESSLGDQTQKLTQSFADKKSRYISRKVKQAVLKRAHHQCEYVHTSGKRCASKFQTQFDHVKAFSRGGSSESTNIQLLCRVHNAYKSNREL